MLQSLYIKNFILIEKLELDFNKGFCVITGDTGAGKSILLDAILFCLGGKFSGNPVHPESDSCSVSIVFTSNNKISDYLRDLDIEIEGDLIIKRTQNNSGRKKFFINDQIVTINIVKQLYSDLLELHGQHNHSLLINSETHMDILDEYGDLSALKGDVSSSYRIWQDLENKIAVLAKERSAIEEEIDYLTHVCAELQEAEIILGEEEKMADLKKHLQNSDKEKSLINSVLEEIKSSAIEQVIAKSQRYMSKIDHIKELEKIHADLDETYDKIEDIKSALHDILESMDSSDHSIEMVEDRLYEIRNLARKHSCRADDLIAFLEKSEEKLSKLQNQIDSNEDLKNEAVIAKGVYFEKARSLSEKRKIIAIELEKKTMQELSKLEMQKAIFKADIKSSDDYSSSKGIDRLCFVASTNPGMDMSPINKIASGGELSRFMLALRVALFNNAPKHTIIFDEIDVGISGSVADSIGQRMKLLSNAVQIIVITHQPQVAGKADQHILVKKSQYESHTSVLAQNLCNTEKSLELARMISGKKITKAGIEAATELLS